LNGIEQLFNNKKTGKTGTKK